MNKKKSNNTADTGTPTTGRTATTGQRTSGTALPRATRSDDAADDVFFADVDDSDPDESLQIRTVRAIPAGADTPEATSGGEGDRGAGNPGSLHDVLTRRRPARRPPATMPVPPTPAAAVRDPQPRATQRLSAGWEPRRALPIALLLAAATIAAILLAIGAGTSSPDLERADRRAERSTSQLRTERAKTARLITNLRTTAAQLAVAKRQLARSRRTARSQRARAERWRRAHAALRRKRTVARRARAARARRATPRPAHQAAPPPPAPAPARPRPQPRPPEFPL